MLMNGDVFVCFSNYGIHEQNHELITISPENIIFAHLCLILDYLNLLSHVVNLTEHVTLNFTLFKL